MKTLHLPITPAAAILVTLLTICPALYGQGIKPLVWTPVTKSDNFQRTNQQGLGTNWASAGTGLYENTNSFGITNENAVSYPYQNANAFYIWTNYSSWALPQFSEITIANAGGAAANDDWSGVCLRVNGVNATHLYYVGQWGAETALYFVNSNLETELATTNFGYSSFTAAQAADCIFGGEPVVGIGFGQSSSTGPGRLADSSTAYWWFIQTNSVGRTPALPSELSINGTNWNGVGSNWILNNTYGDGNSDGDWDWFTWYFGSSGNSAYWTNTNIVVFAAGVFCVTNSSNASNDQLDQWTLWQANDSAFSTFQIQPTSTNVDIRVHGEVTQYGTNTSLNEHVYYATWGTPYFVMLIQDSTGVQSKIPQTTVRVYSTNSPPQLLASNSILFMTNDIQPTYCMDLASGYLENFPGYALYGPMQVYMNWTNWSQVDGILTNTGANYPTIEANWDLAPASSTNGWQAGDVLRAEAMGPGYPQNGGTTPTRLYAYRNGECIMEYIDWSNLCKQPNDIYPGVGMGYSDSTLAISNWTGGNLLTTPTNDLDTFQRPNGLLGGPINSGVSEGGWWVSTLPDAGSIQIAGSNAVINTYGPLCTANGYYQGPWAIWCDPGLWNDQCVQTYVASASLEGWIGVTAKNTFNGSNNSFYVLLDLNNTATYLYEYDSSLLPGTWPFTLLTNVNNTTAWSPGDIMRLEASGGPECSTPVTLTASQMSSGATNILFRYADSKFRLSGPYVGMELYGSYAYLTNWSAWSVISSCDDVVEGGE